MLEEIKGRFNSGKALSQMCQNVLPYLFVCKCTVQSTKKLNFVCLYIYIYIRKLSEKITLVQTLQNKTSEVFFQKILENLSSSLYFMRIC